MQIRDPKFKKVVFINVSSGEYRSNLPANTLFKPLEENQWWQLYDVTSSCYYYYNTSSHQTIWKRPSNVEIIPLYRVQQFNNEVTKDWKIFLNEKFENFKKTNPYKTSASRWNLLSRNRKYSFTSNNNLENIKLNSIHIGPLTSKSRLNQLKSSLSDDEGLDTLAQDFCSVGNIGYSTLLTAGSRQFCDYTRIRSSPSSKSKASDGMSRSFDQMNKDEWELIGVEKPLNSHKGINLRSNKPEVLTPQKHQQNFPRTNPHVTMQRSASSFRSNKDFLFSKDRQHVIPNARSVADHLHDNSATLRRATDLSKKKHVHEVDQELTKSFFASSFNFRNNVKGESVQLLSYKSGQDFNQFRSTDDPVTRIGQPSQSSLVASSVMSASVKSCDTTDDFNSVDQTSFCSAATRGTDECDGNSVFSSSSTPPPMRTSSMPAWSHRVQGTDEENRNTLKKLEREKSMESAKNVSSKRDRRPHGMCYSESDAQWEDDLPNFQYVASEGSHITPFAQYVIKELSLSSFNDHRKRFLGKSVPVGSLLHWTKDGLRKPILRTSNRIVNREAPDVLKRIQLYMGDRHFKRSHSSTSSSMSLVKMNAHIALVHETTNSSLLDQSILTVIVKGWMLPEMRDEIYIQLCKQTNGNPRLESIQKGWELMCICLSFFPPARMTSSLKQRFNETTSTLLSSNHPKLRCCLKQLPRRLEQALASGAKRGVCKPTAQEFEVSRESIYTPPLFGSLLSEVMEVQKGKFPERQLPWILTTLSEAVLRLNGMNMEGIFRIPGDIDEVNRLKAGLSNKWAFPDEPLKFDASVPASLLKLWLRQLHEPLIPYDIYNDCLEASNNPPQAIDIVSARLPHINHLVLAYVIRFLQVFAAAPVSSKTKMDANNLAMVMAPNILRCHITDPTLLLDQAKKEMSFVRLLILMWDTSFMENIV